MFKWTDFEKISRCFVDGVTEQEVAHIDINKMILTDTITNKKFTLTDESLSAAKLTSQDILFKHWNTTDRLISKVLNGIN